MLTREQIAMRAARELHDAATVYLDEGIPQLIASQLPAGVRVISAGEPDAVDVAVLTGSAIANDGAYLGSALGARGAKKVLVLIERHQAEDGSHRVLKQLSEASGKAQQVLTSLALFDVTPEGLVMREVVQGVSALDVQLQSEPPLLAADDLKLMQF